MTQKDVLVITGGLAPQLVTETLYALADQANAPRAKSDFWPEQVIVAGTAANRGTFKAQRLAERIAELCGVMRRSIPTLEVSIPAGEIEDVRTAADAEAFGNMMVRLIRRITADNKSRLHVSLAGGRKTMSFHAGVALSLYGRPKDRLSHALLVPPQAERASAFWYPTTFDVMLMDSQGVPLAEPSGAPLNGKYVKIDLADIPYFSVRHLLPKDLLERDLNYADVVVMVGMALKQTPITLTLAPASRQVTLPGLSPIKLGPREFAFYQLLCERARDGALGAGPEGEGGNHSGWLSNSLLARPQDCDDNPVRRYIDIYDGLRGSGSQKDSGSQKSEDQRALVDTRIIPRWEKDDPAAVIARNEKQNTGLFAELRTHIGTKFAAHVTNPEVRETIFQDNVKDTAKRVRFGVNVSPANIFILEP